MYSISVFADGLFHQGTALTSTYQCWSSTISPCVPDHGLDTPWRHRSDILPLFTFTCPTSPPLHNQTACVELPDLPRWLVCPRSCLRPTDIFTSASESPFERRSQPHTPSTRRTSDAGFPIPIWAPATPIRRRFFPCPAPVPATDKFDTWRPARWALALWPTCLDAGLRRRCNAAPSVPTALWTFRSTMSGGGNDTVCFRS
jgi:hypothetical protein